MIFMEKNRLGGKYFLFLLCIILSSCTSSRYIFLCNDSEHEVIIDMINYNGVRTIDTLDRCDSKIMASKAVGRIIFKIEETDYEPWWYENQTAKIYFRNDTIYLKTIEDLQKLDKLTKNEKRKKLKECKLKREQNKFIFFK